MPEKQPKVALVHDHLVQDGGAERVMRTLMKMYPEAPVYTLLYDPGRMGPDFAGKDIRTSVLQKVPIIRRHYKFLLLFIDWAFRRFDLSDYDLVISSSSGFAKSVRTPPQTLHICYCHTPTRYLWSDADRYIAETGYPAALKWLFKRTLASLRRKDLRGARGVDVFVANSDTVADRIKKYYGRTGRVIHPPVDVNQFSPGDSTDDYFLAATRLEPYKRVDLAIAAANRLKVPLKVMGSGTDRPRLERLAGATVTFLGRVNDHERARLFAEARAFINPQEEDFGITVVEALASGTPVIAYAKGGAREILTEETGVLFEPQTEEALAAAIESFDGRSFDAATLRRRAEQFSEEAFVEGMRSAVERSLL